MRRIQFLGIWRYKWILYSSQKAKLSVNNNKTSTCHPEQLAVSANHRK